jgi:hypothetical protein
MFTFFLVPLLFAFVSSRGRNYFFFPFFIKHSFITPFSSLEEGRRETKEEGRRSFA